MRTNSSLSLSLVAIRALYFSPPLHFLRRYRVLHALRDRFAHFHPSPASTFLFALHSIFFLLFLFFFFLFFLSPSPPSLPPRSPRSGVTRFFSPPAPAPHLLRSFPPPITPSSFTRHSLFPGCTCSTRVCAHA